MPEIPFLYTIFKPGDFNESELALICNKFKPITIPKNEYLHREGKTAHTYWFLEQGFIRSYVSDTKGNDISTAFYRPGDVVIDWSSFFLRMPGRESIQTLSKCICWECSYDDFQELFNGIKTFREHGRSRLVTDYFRLKNQSISLIADSAKERYLQLLHSKPEIILHVPQQHIASYLGITKYSLSRIRKEITGKTHFLP